MDPLDRIWATRGHVSNLWKALAPDGDFVNAAFGLYTAVMHRGPRPGGLSRRERELVCFATSVANGCAYCVNFHRRHLVLEGQPEAEVAGLEADPAFPLADPTDALLRDLALALARDAAADLDFARAALPEPRFREAVEVAALYALANRLSLGFQVPLD